jgi:Secretion system C-terminal sorting domain
MSNFNNRVSTNANFASTKLLIRSFLLTLLWTTLIFGQETIFVEDWETGIGSWYADNGLWEVGQPTVGPDSVYLNANCVGTLINSNYPSNANTRLISPTVQLPSKNFNETLQLKLWHWFQTKEYQTDYPYSYNPDKCVIEISVNSGDWKPLFDYSSGKSIIWSQIVLDISAYANSSIRLGFYFYSSGNNEDNGWYIDDISIIKSIVQFKNPEDFENGIDNWGVDNGLWEVGVPIIGPTSTHSDENCAGIVLKDHYPNFANTRLISPKIKLAPIAGRIPELFFWHWFQMKEYQTDYPYSYNPDYGYLQIKTDNSEWQTLGNPFTGESATWTQTYIDLSEFADSTVRLGFYFTSTANNEDIGWYIDDIRIEGIEPITSILKEVDIPEIFSLEQNYPNPFNPTTNIKFSLPKAGNVNIDIYNTLGQTISTIINEKKAAGIYEISFNAKNTPSGVYFYRIQAGEFTQVKKMLLIR